MSANISIITVGMNHLKYIKDLYASIYKEGLKDTVEVIYVDNCSVDGSVDFLKEHYPSIKIIVNDSPKGFGENNNIGAKIAKGKYLAIINPDIILTDNCLDDLFCYLEAHSDIGICVPKLLNLDRSYQYSVRRFITPKLFISRAFAKGEDAKELVGNSYYLCKDLNVDKVQYINWAVGAAYFMAREHYNKLGGFDEDYFLYMEDEDLCLRSWKLKAPVVYLPHAVMIHNHMRSSKKFGKTMVYHFKSLFTFWNKHGLSIPDYVKKSN